MATASPFSTGTPAEGRIGMAVRGFLCQNIAIGCAFGGFGVAAGEIKSQFDVSTGMASMGLAFAVLMMGLVSPIVARMIGSVGLRRTMLTGIVLSGLGYVVLAFAPSIYVVLAAYGLFVGVGIAMFGSFPCSVLASNWFQPNPGAALGFVNMPVMVALVPMMGIFLIERYGLSTFYLVMAGLHILLLPFALGVADRPEGAARAGDDAQGSTAHAMISSRAILGRPIFWIVVLGAGGLSAAGIIGVSHLVSFAIEKHIPPAQAAFLLSVMGAAAALGSLLVGVLCGKIGAVNTLALMGAALAGSWFVLLGTSLYPLMICATLIIGACGAGIFPAVNVLGARVFGVDALARVLGLFTLYTLPMNFLLPPAAGVLRDATASYEPVVGVLIAGSGAIAAMFVLLGRVMARQDAVREKVAV